MVIQFFPGVRLPYKNREDRLAAKRRWSKSEQGRASATNYTQRLSDGARTAKRDDRKAEFDRNGWRWDEVLYWTKHDNPQRRALIGRYKAEIGCGQCGIAESAILRFTEAPRGQSVSAIADSASGYKLLLAMAQSKVSCLNCYRKGHPARHEIRVILEARKAEIGCRSCGIKDGTCLDYHHKDPATKTIEVSKLVRTSLGAALKEAQKCEVLCANCHVLEHRDLKVGAA